MRLVKFKGETLNIQMSVLTPFFYKQQFDRDFGDDLLSYLRTNDKSIANRLVWSMSKTSDFDLIDFNQWILIFEEKETNWKEINIEIDRYFANYKPQPKDNKSKNKTVIYENYETKQIGSALQLGFSFESLRYILPSDLHNMIDDTEKARQATQDDIDMLLA